MNKTKSIGIDDTENTAIITLVFIPKTYDLYAHGATDKYIVTLLKNIDAANKQYTAENAKSINKNAKMPVSPLKNPNITELFFTTNSDFSDIEIPTVIPTTKNNKQISAYNITVNLLRLMECVSLYIQSDNTNVRLIQLSI